MNASAGPVGSVVYREDEARDEVTVRVLLQAAFGGTAEALLVNQLRSNGEFVLALVAAEATQRIVGYVGFPRLASKVKTKAQPPGKIDDVYADRYARQLLDAGTDKAAFYAIFEQVKSDARIKLAEADAIARQYKGYRAKYKRKPATFEDIEKGFIERARFENKIGATR